MKVVSVLGVGVVLTLCTAPAFAQAPEREPFSRSYVSVLAGATVDGDSTPVFAGEYGERVSRHVQAYVNVAYFDDLMSVTMQNSLVAASALLSDVTNSAYRFSGRDRGIALTGGAKVSPAAIRAFRPYVGLGFGALNLSRTIVEESLGDVTESFVEQLGVSDGNILSTDTSSTKPMAEAIAGAGIVAGRTYVDINYRFRKAFHTVEPIEFSQLSVGVGVRF